MTHAADTADVLALNAELYAAVESADLDRLGALWVDGAWAADALCVHPGWPVLHGRARIMRSWAAILAGTSYLQFVLTDVAVVVAGDVAVVTCGENILTSTGEVLDSGFGGGTATATNVFRRGPGGWRLWVHHASPVLSSGSLPEPGEESDPG